MMIFYILAPKQCDVKNIVFTISQVLQCFWNCIILIWQMQGIVYIYMNLSSDILQYMIHMSVSYCKTSITRCTKSQNLNDSHPVLQLSLPNPLRKGG